LRKKEFMEYSKWWQKGVKTTIPSKATIEDIEEITSKESPGKDEVQQL